MVRPCDVESEARLAQLTRLQERKSRIAIALADADALDTLNDALAETRTEEAALEAQIRDIEQRAQLRGQRQSIVDQLKTLAKQARTRLADPTPELMAQVFDSLELDLTRVDSNVFEGTGSIPILEDGTGDLLGEVHEGGLRRPYSRLTAIRFRIEVAA